MASRGNTVLVRSARCLLIKTQFNKAGDENVFTMPAAGVLTPVNFTRKTIVTRGSFCTEFEDGNDYTYTKEIWPLKEHQHPGKFTTKALEANSEYYCVVPTNKKEMITSTQELAVGETIELAVGTVNFVYGENYQVNSKTYNAVDVFVADKQAATLVATAPVTLVQCSARPD